MNEELRWKNGRGKKNGYGPRLRVSSLIRRPPMSRGQYGTDDKFHESEAISKDCSFRSATQDSSESNGRPIRKERGHDHVGMSRLSAANPRVEKAKIPLEIHDTLMTRGLEEAAYC